MINQTDLVAKLDTFLGVGTYIETDQAQLFPPGYESVLQRFTAPDFLSGSWNGLMLDNTETLDRVYLIVFPAQSVLDTIIAREVQRGAPGALIFAHYMADYQEAGPGTVHVTETQLEDLREHKVSYYVSHAPLDCNPEISTSGALANALKLKEQVRFGAYCGGLAGVHGKIGPLGFTEFANKVAEATALPRLRYGQLRHNGRAIQHVAIISGVGEIDFIREAVDIGCDTFVAGEWWLFGPGDWRMQHRERMREFLRGADINLIGTTHYASKAVVLREPMLAWFKDNIPTVEAVFIPQDDPSR